MSLLRIKVTLEGVEPAIWRLIEMGGSRTLAELHDAIQLAMGWTDSHLHVFEHPDGRRWAAPAVEDGLADGDEGAVTLAEVVSGGFLTYEYDLGDSWTHGLAVVGASEGDDSSVVLLDGARSAPPEDCGGPDGYEHLLATLADTTSDDHLVASEWLARSRHPWSSVKAFDPESLDLERCNRRLAERFRLGGLPAAWGSELAALVELMPAGARAAFGDRLDGAALDRAVVFGPGDAAACVQPFRWLLGRVGSSLALTSAGRLPPAVVLQASAELGWDQRWTGAMNREDHVPAAFVLRDQAIKTLLLRKYRGALLPTRAGAVARRDPVVLLGHLATHALRLSAPGPEREAAVLLLVELAAGGEPERETLAETVAFGLHVRGYVAQGGWSPPTPLSVSGLLAPTWALLGGLGLVRDHFRDLVPGSPRLVQDFARLVLQEG